MGGHVQPRQKQVHTSACCLRMELLTLDARYADCATPHTRTSGLYSDRMLMYVIAESYTSGRTPSPWRMWDPPCRSAEPAVSMLRALLAVSCF